MSSAEFLPVKGSIQNFPVRGLGKTTILPDVTFRTYSPAFKATFGQPWIAYDQFAATYHHTPSLPPDLKLPRFTAEFGRFSRCTTFLAFCKTIDQRCKMQNKGALGRKDKEHLWVSILVYKFQQCTLWDRGALVGWDVGKGKRLADLEEVGEWLKKKFCEKVEELRDKKANYYWIELGEKFPGIDIGGFVCCILGFLGGWEG
jgi:hypothetical protein